MEKKHIKIKRKTLTWYLNLMFYHVVIFYGRVYYLSNHKYYEIRDSSAADDLIKNHFYRAQKLMERAFFPSIFYTPPFIAVYFFLEKYSLSSFYFGLFLFIIIIGGLLLSYFSEENFLHYYLEFRNDKGVKLIKRSFISWLILLVGCLSLPIAFFTTF